MDGHGGVVHLLSTQTKQRCNNDLKGSAIIIGAHVDIPTVFMSNNFYSARSFLRRASLKKMRTFREMTI